MKNKLLTFFTAFVLILLPFGSALPVYAATTTTHSSWWDGFVGFFTQKFGLNQNQVQSALSDYKNQQKQTLQQHMQANEKKHLDTLVSQGKITADQEQQILDEQATLRSEYNPTDWKSMTADQRKAQIQKEQDEIKAWSQSTGIDAKYLMRPFRMGMRMRMFNRWNQHLSPTPTP